MQDELDKYFLNAVVKTAKPKISFSWLQIVDEIISKYQLPFDSGESIEARIYAYRGSGWDFSKQLTTLLVFLYICPAGSSTDNYILTKKGIEARKFESIEDYELLTTPLKRLTHINYKKFDRKIISFLKKQPQKFGEISHIINSFIKDIHDNKIPIHKQLVYLSRDRDIIEIKDISEDPSQMQDDWWGNFRGVNINRGDKVEGLMAKLSNGYMRLSWWQRNPIKTKILDWGIPAILGFLLGIVTCNSTKPADTQEHQLQFVPADTAIGPKKHGGATNGDTLLYNKDSLKGIKP